MTVSTSNMGNMITLVNWEQVMPIDSKSTMLYCRLAGHLRKFLAVKMFTVMKKFMVVMTVLGMQTRMCMTTLHRRVASAPGTNRSCLFLKGEGHHW